MNLYIKNMVCSRCIWAVKNILEEISIDFTYVELGVVRLNFNLTNDQKNKLNKKLKDLGFEILNDYQEKIIEKIKSIIISRIQTTEYNNINLSEEISQRLNKDYSFLSKLFSTTEGITIEQYIILQRIEKVKELLSYNEISLSEISYLLNYSSLSHLSSQFKRVTGLTPSQYKAKGLKLRKPLDKI